MRSVNQIQNIRRVLLWSLPFLAAMSLIFSPVLNLLHQQDWKTYLQEYQTRSSGDSQWYRGGDIAVDTTGKIWIAGGARLTGLHTFDGETWTNHEGNFQDLAIAPNGQVSAVHAFGDNVFGVDVFDGQQWTNYAGADYGIKSQTILQAEVTSDGQIWITTNPWGSNNKYGSDHAVEIINEEGEAYGVISDLQVKGTDGFIRSLDADKHGNIWASVWTYEDDTPGLEAGLYMHDGESWQKVPDQGVDLRRVVRTRFDDQGNAWIITECGGVMSYDGRAWTVVIEENDSPVCSSEDKYNGLYLDDNGRLWLWQHDSVHMLNDGTWISFTVENSGLSEIDDAVGGIFGVVVDEQNQLWVASSGGVTMIPVEDSKPLPDEIVRTNRTMQSLGINWFLASVLMLLWVAVYFNIWPGVLVAVVIGILVTNWIGAPIEGPGDYGIYELNPGVLVTFGGMVGGLIGGQIDKGREADGASNQNMNFVLAFIGLVLGLVCYFPLAIMSSP